MRALVLTASVLAALALPTSASGAVTAGGTGWVWGNPLPQGGDLDAIAFSGARGIAVGADGVILRTEDAGASWSAVASGTEADLNEVAMPDASTVYAGGGCVLRRSTDGGTTFTRVRFVVRETRCSSELAQIAFPTPSLGYLILTDGKVLRTTNGGRSFTRRATLPIGSSVPQGGAADAEFTSDTTGLIATGLSSPAFLRTQDAGQTWTSITVADAGGFFARAVSLDFVTPLLVYAVGNGDIATGPPMAKSEDGGVTWTTLPLAGASGVPRAIDCADAGNCAIAAADNQGAPGNRVTWTSDGGATGTTLVPGAGVEDVAFSSATRLVTVGAGGATLASDDAGHSLARVGGLVPGQFLGLRPSGAGTVVAFAGDGSLAHSRDGGLTWQALGTAPLSGLADVSFVTDSVG
jgi:photosystem II stability/assembly factor-like uncharacterized protein